MAPARRILARIAVVTALLLFRATSADVLPDDRADIFYSKYSGGGMDITGESVLVRKKFTENFAVEANYFIDKVSGASIDVLSNASTIKDERKQKAGTVQYMHDKTTYSLSYINSTERDYVSNTTHFSLSQDMFGDLTTLTLGFGSTQDRVGENNGTANKPVIAWLGHADTRSYEGGLSQILTKNLIVGANLEVITDAGYLANPYRSIRYVAENPKGYSLASQVYPDTRTSTAIETQAKYYLPYRAAVTGSYRYYTDTWGIVGNTYELDYTHPIKNLWILEGRLRYYKQGAANFYSDLYPYADSQNFTGRDQDLASAENTTIGAKITYAFLPDGGWKIFKRGTATFDISRVQYKYLDFRNIKDYGLPQYQPGTEPLYHFNAIIGQLYVSMFF
jgi:Protein of unknown function (DUF3570)